VTPEDEFVLNPRRRHPLPVKKTDPPQNQVNAEPNFGPDHGAVAVYSPAPVIPAYLRNQNLQASVVIEFFVTAQGQATPRLLDSSGNDELDAIALDTVKKWEFKPAVKNNAPLDSKSRLRIRFEVY
ncbi:MAG TPA: energy transducer TonB, partial [bacterium]|nr:energy transducer TonB [bacterium]